MTSQDRETEKSMYMLLYTEKGGRRLSHKNLKMHSKPTLTHLSLAPLLWDKGKQNRPRCDAAERGVPSGPIKNFHRKIE